VGSEGFSQFSKPCATVQLFVLTLSQASFISLMSEAPVAFILFGSAQTKAIPLPQAESSRRLVFVRRLSFLGRLNGANVKLQGLVFKRLHMYILLARLYPCKLISPLMIHFNQRMSYYFLLVGRSARAIVSAGCKRKLHTFFSAKYRRTHAINLRLYPNRLLATRTLSHT